MSLRDYADVVREYNQRAPYYDQHWRSYIEATTQATIRRISLRGPCQFLDLGCGTGNLIDGLLTLSPSATAVGADASFGMLGVATCKMTRPALLVCADAHHLPLRTQCLDLVVCCNAFHFLRKPDLALSEIKRVLRPGGELAITDWCDDYVTCRAYDFFFRIFNRAHFKMYGSRECKTLLEQAGFQVTRLDRYKISWLWGLMTVIAKLNSSESAAADACG